MVLLKAGKLRAHRSSSVKAADCTDDRPHLEVSYQYNLCPLKQMPAFPKPHPQPQTNRAFISQYSTAQKRLPVLRHMTLVTSASSYWWGGGGGAGDIQINCMSCSICGCVISGIFTLVEMLHGVYGARVLWWQNPSWNHWEITPKQKLCAV